LERFTPAVEGASIDEWYLDLSGTEALYRHESLETTARRIRAAVLDEAGYALSIGAGPNKLVAKLAAERAKPSKAPQAQGVFVVDDGRTLDFMRTVALADIPGIGPKLQQTLRNVGLTTVEETLPHDLATLTRWVGTSTASWLYARVRGESESSVESRAPAKQISREETFRADISDAVALERELRFLAAKVAADLRGDGLAARTITVKLRTTDFDTRTASRTLPEAVESDHAITEVALTLVRALRARRPGAARLVGVAVSNFGAARDAEQLSMFGGGAATPVEQPRDRDLSRALDRVREKFGDEAIHAGPTRRGAIGEKGARKPRD
jgi:DNA polymerase-4